MKFIGGILGADTGDRDAALKQARADAAERQAQLEAEREKLESVNLEEAGHLRDRRQAAAAGRRGIAPLLGSAGFGQFRETMGG